MTNPLLQKSNLQYQAPRFDLIKDEHFKPAFEYGLKIHDEELAQIRNLGEDTFYRLDALPIVSVNSLTSRSAISHVAGLFASSALKFSFTKELGLNHLSH